jgi:D-arabinose 1-dehydrogenase-like Zn-dependent alcohol dehydrogenase
LNIRAAVVDERGAPFAIEDLELGELRDDEVLVEIAASRICHTDLTFYDFEQIEQAARDAESGGVIKPVLRTSERSK